MTKQRVRKPFAPKRIQKYAGQMNPVFALAPEPAYWSGFIGENSSIITTYNRGQI